MTTLVSPRPEPYVAGGIGEAASVNWPAALVVNPKTGALFVADEWDNVLLMVD